MRTVHPAHIIMVHPAHIIMVHPEHIIMASSNQSEATADGEDVGFARCVMVLGGLRLLMVFYCFVPEGWFLWVVFDYWWSSIALYLRGGFCGWSSIAL
jgi:hypothetical protein